MYAIRSYYAVLVRRPNVHRLEAQVCDPLARLLDRQRHKLDGGGGSPAVASLKPVKAQMFPAEMLGT